MSDASGSGGDDMDLRAQVFERLNTGGERLNPQELRNSLYSGNFNKLLVDLAKQQPFTSAWDIPSNEEHTRSDGTPDDILRENNLFKRMLDVEIVLRFFAFREDATISGSVRGMLDNTMKNLRNPTEAALGLLKAEFTEALSTARAVFGNQVFRLPPPEGRPRGTLSRPLYDAEMVALHRLRDRRNEMLVKGAEISTAVHALAKPDSARYDLMVGRGNTAALIKERISLVQETVASRL